MSPQAHVFEHLIPYLGAQCEGHATFRRWSSAGGSESRVLCVLPTMTDSTAQTLYGKMTLSFPSRWGIQAQQQKGTQTPINHASLLQWSGGTKGQNSSLQGLERGFSG